MPSEWSADAEMLKNTELEDKSGLRAVVGPEGR